MRVRRLVILSLVAGAFAFAPAASAVAGPASSDAAVTAASSCPQIPNVKITCFPVRAKG